MKFDNYFFILILILLQSKPSYNSNTSTKGPYKTTVTSVKTCLKTTLPRPKPELLPANTFYMEIYNTSKKPNLLRGNLTFHQHGVGFMIKSNAYIWEGRKWKPHISLPSLDCKTPVVAFLLKLTNFNYNPSSCSFQKGVYSFSKVDFNAAEHFWAKERMYGRVMWRAEVLTKYNTLLCVIFETIVEPLKQTGIKKKEARGV